MKKLFTNYNFEFDKNEKKILKTFCNQTLKQVDGDNRFYAEAKAFHSIIEKLESGAETIKLTKEERSKLMKQLEENVKYLKKEMEKSWFFKKWLYKSMYKQYTNILATHFEG
jgi:predicted AlkP superfamily phosphohydrolase/phosphomutase